jgi:hypothetical protein
MGPNDQKHDSGAKNQNDRTVAWGSHKLSGLPAEFQKPAWKII